MALRTRSRVDDGIAKMFAVIVRWQEGRFRPVSSFQFPVASFQITDSNSNSNSRFQFQRGQGESGIEGQRDRKEEGRINVGSIRRQSPIYLGTHRSVGRPTPRGGCESDESVSRPSLGPIRRMGY